MRLFELAQAVHEFCGRLAPVLAKLRRDRSSNGCWKCVELGGRNQQCTGRCAVMKKRDNVVSFAAMAAMHVFPHGCAIFSARPEHLDVGIESAQQKAIELSVEPAGTPKSDNAAANPSPKAMVNFRLAARSVRACARRNRRSAPASSSAAGNEPNSSRYRATSMQPAFRI